MIKENNVTENNIIQNILTEKLHTGKVVSDTLKDKFALLSKIGNTKSDAAKEDMDKSVIRAITKQAMREYENGNVVFDIFNTNISSKYDLTSLVQTLDKYGIAIIQTSNTTVFQIYDELALFNNFNKKANSLNREKSVEKLVAVYTSDTMFKLSRGERIELELTENKIFANPYSHRESTINILLLTINEINTLVSVLKDKYDLMLVGNKIVID